MCKIPWGNLEVNEFVESCGILWTMWDTGFDHFFSNRILGPWGIKSINLDTRRPRLHQSLRIYQIVPARAPTRATRVRYCHGCSNHIPVELHPSVGSLKISTMPSLNTKGKSEKDGEIHSLSMCFQYVVINKNAVKDTKFCKTRCSPRTRMLTRMLMVQRSKHMDMQSRTKLFCNSLFEQSCTYFPCYQSAVWSGKCRVWSVECKVRSVECGVGSVKCGVWSVGCGV